MELKHAVHYGQAWYTQTHNLIQRHVRIHNLPKLMWLHTKLSHNV